MAKVQVNVRLDERICAAMDGLDRALVIRNALTQYLKLDPDRLVSLEEIELERERKLRAARNDYQAEIAPTRIVDTRTEDEMLEGIVFDGEDDQ